MKEIDNKNKSYNYPSWTWDPNVTPDEISAHYPNHPRVIAALINNELAGWRD